MIKNMDIPTQLAIKHAKINQLSSLVEDLNNKDKPAVKDVINQLKGAVKAHAKQAKDLEKSMKTEMAKDKAYAIGMATAKKKFNDEPPLDKKTIKKAHEIGDKLSKMKKENKDHPAKAVYEQIEGLKNKAEKSGMPYGILKKVYDRGMAAWRGGHRPGTTQQQWAFARVNSFITKSSGTWGGADKDLAAKVKGK
jgi:outer membrane murein-binding lipoprotein Lpp